MLSTMTVKINTLVQTLTNGGVAFSNGVLEFYSYSKEGVISTNLNYEAYGATAVALMGAGINSNGVAVGYIDTVDKLPVFRIQFFISTSNLPSAVAKTEKEPANIAFE